MYCDQTRFGGGWTLLVSNAGGGGFTHINLFKRYATAPSITSDYSILGSADAILQASASFKHPWSYIVEVELAGANNGSIGGNVIGGVYSAPPNASLLVSAGSIAARKSVSLVQMIGGWEESPLGLQHLLPEINVPSAAQHSATSPALLSTSARPAANPWGSLVNEGEPTACHASTANFAQCSVRARLWIREALPSNATVCDPAACAAAATADNQCKEAECSADGQCLFRLHRPDGTPCNNGDAETLHDECDLGKCRGWTLLARQQGLLMVDIAQRALDGELVSDGSGAGAADALSSSTYYFNLGVARSLYKGRRKLEYALRWPGSLFRMQVWRQANLPWEGHGRANAVAFEPRRVSIVGFEGLVGNYTKRNLAASSPSSYAVALAPTPVVEIGATAAYFGGLAGPGLLPVDTVELYARTDESPTTNWAIAMGIAGGLFVGAVAMCVWRRHKAHKRKAARCADVEIVKPKPKPNKPTKKSLSSVKIAPLPTPIPTQRETAAPSQMSPVVNARDVTPPPSPPESATVRKPPGVLERQKTYAKMHAARQHWSLVREAFEERRGPLQEVKRSPKSEMRNMMKQFVGPDGKLNRRKLLRLEAMQRRVLRKQRTDLRKQQWKQAMHDEAFLVGTYAFDLLSPRPERLGKFAPVFTCVLVVVCAILFAFLSGQYASGGQYQLETRFTECEAEQAIIQSSVSNASTLSTLVASLEAARAAAGHAQLMANVSAAKQIEVIWDSLSSSGKEAKGKAAADDSLQADTQAAKSGLTQERAATGHEIAKAVDKQEAAARGEITLSQAEIDAAAKAIAKANGLVAREGAMDEALKKSREAVEAEEQAAAQKRQLATAQISQVLAAMETQVEKASREEASASAQLAIVQHGLDVLSNAFDPWAALGSLDPALQDARSAALLNAKILAISADGYGVPEHSCTLFQPEAISPATLGQQMQQWTSPYAQPFLARWGARYAPAMVNEGEGHRWIASAFIHGSWSQMIIGLFTLICVGSLCERRYGSLRVMAVFAFSALGGNFLGAVADDVCVVSVGSTAACSGLIGMFLVDLSIAFAETKAVVARRAELLLCSFSSLLQFATMWVELELSSAATNIGGLLCGLLFTFLFLPGFLREKWEALVPLVVFVVAVILFAVLPWSFYNGNPAPLACTLT